MISLIIILVLSVALAAIGWLLQKKQSELTTLKIEFDRLERAENITKESFSARLKEKDEMCRRTMEEKDDACKKLLEAKENACTAALTEKTATCERLIADKEKTMKQMIADRDAQQEKVLREKNEEIDRFLSEKEKSFANAVKTLQEQFANLAAQTLKIQSGDLTKTNSEQMELILKPLREQLETLKSATEKTQCEHSKLAETINKDVGRISDMTKELSEVSKALSSNPGFQGRKGEEILAEKLRQAGLEEGINFFLQTGTATDRPDAQVCDTENRWLIIDSKVVLSAYFQYVEATDEATRKEKLAEHVERVRQKIDQLAKKKYPDVFAAEHKDRNYLPVTAMFVGYEAPLLEALKAEPSLWKFAADNNVILVTPLTLLAYLRLVYLAWQHEKEVRNQAEIISTARELLKRVNAFLLTFENLGASLKNVQTQYENARTALIDAPHAQTIAKAANKLIDLHVRLESRKGKRIEMAECLSSEIN